MCSRKPPLTEVARGVRRWRPRVNAHVMFNGWELPGDASWPDLQPAGAPREDGSDWWRLLVNVPSDSYEVHTGPRRGQRCWAWD